MTRRKLRDPDNYSAEDFAKEIFPDAFPAGYPFNYQADWDQTRALTLKHYPLMWDYDLTWVRENLDEVGLRSRAAVEAAVQLGDSTWLTMREAIMLSRRFPTRWAGYVARVRLGLVKAND